MPLEYSPFLEYKSYKYLAVAFSSVDQPLLYYSAAAVTQCTLIFLSLATLDKPLCKRIVLFGRARASSLHIYRLSSLVLDLQDYHKSFLQHVFSYEYQ